MNVSTASPKESRFRNSAPPGARTASPEINTDAAEVKDAVEVRFDDQGPAGVGLSVWQKVVGGTLAGVAGLAAFAPQAANAAPAQALVTQTISQSDGLEVTVLPRGTARVDLLRQTTHSSGIGRSSGDRESNVAYSDVGVHIGRGVFHDSNGNLVLVPSLAAGWNDGITDFKRVELDIPGRNQDVTRYGNTTHLNRGTTDRTIFVDHGATNTLDVHHRGHETKYEVLRNGVQYRSERGVEWRVTQDGTTLNVDGPDNDDAHLTYSANSIDVTGPHLQNSISLGSNRITTNGSGPDYDVSRSAGGEVIRVQARGASNVTITQEGNNVVRVQGAGGSSFTVDPADFMNRTTINFNELSRMIEQAEPGYVQAHPLIMGLLEYATANPGLVGEETSDATGLLQAGSGIAAAGGTIESGVALGTGAHALSLAENARALGGAALRAQAAAQAAGQAGNLSQAAALGNQARTLAGQARGLGDQAVHLGEQYHNTAQVARVLTGVAGAIEIVDGTIDIHRGSENRSVVEGAIVITESLRERLSQEQTGAELERTQEDYSKVMQILRGLQKNADKQVRVGGLKIGCGGLLLISALAGGALIPPILGAIGAICTAGTAVYEHWDELKAFFNGEELQPDPTLRNVLPEQVQGEVLFRLD